MILKMGKSHAHHLHQHKLRLQQAQGPYKCNGCKQPGFTTCFKCPKNVCDFYLHEACFLARDFPYKTHKFMEPCGGFYYHDSPPSGADRYCDACGLDILGFRYECSSHGENPHDLHPTCAFTTTNNARNWNGLKLKLQDKVKSECLHCDQRYPAEECVGFTGWKWESEESDYGFPFCCSSRKICYEMYHKRSTC